MSTSGEDATDYTPLSCKYLHNKNKINGTDSKSQTAVVLFYTSGGSSAFRSVSTTFPSMEQVEN